MEAAAAAAAAQRTLMYGVPWAVLQQASRIQAPFLYLLTRRRTTTNLGLGVQTADCNSG